MTDGEIVRIARQIDRLEHRIEKLVSRIANSDHPGAADITQALYDNGFASAADPSHVVSHFLIHPDKWEILKWGIKHRPARRKRQTVPVAEVGPEYEQRNEEIP